MYFISKSAKCFTLLFVLFLGVEAIAIAAGQEAIGTANPVADLVFGSQRIDWQLKSAKAEITLIVAAPDGQIHRKVFGAGTVPTFALKPEFADGQYTYELRVSAPGTPRIRAKQDEMPVYNPLESEMVQSGTFVVNQGSIVLPGLKEPVKPTTTGNAFRASGEKTTVGAMDVVHADDVIVTGSMCVGFDCLIDGTENFGFDTIKMKENNLQIFFDDTSATAGFPANDWRIVANDSSSGGSNYLSIHDATGAKVPFKIIAGARTNSIFVSSTGRVGLGTATPVLDLHLVRGDSPSIRLEQDTTSGWTAQTWDIAGNESNFFVRDTTGGSKLPFRIQPGTPTNTLTMKSDGKVGIGTWAPGYPLELQTTGVDANLVTYRTDGVKTVQSGTADFAQFGSLSNHPLRLVTSSLWRLRLDSDNSLTMRNGATCTVGGVWTNASSRELKENINGLSFEEALATLDGLNPVKYNYKVAKAETHVGFIAEDVPDLVASQDRKGMSPMDVVAVLTKVVQEQQKTIKELEERLQKLEEKQ